MTLPSIQIGWIVFVALWALSLGEIVEGSPQSNLWKLAVIYLSGAFVVTVRKYYVYRYELKFLREFHHLSQTMDDLRVLGSSNPFRRFLEAVVSIIGFDRAILFLKQDEGKTLRAVQAYNLDEKILANLVLPHDLGFSQAWKVMETTEAIIVNSLQHQAESNKHLLELIKSTATAYVPIVRANASLGLLMVDRHRSNAPISDDDILQLQVLADQIGVALQNLALHEDISQKARLLETQNARYKKELQLARIVQEGVLPRVAPGWPGLSLASIMRPARFIGGDFFSYLDGCKQGKSACKKPDCSDCENNVRGILIGDVCGTGIPAALIMAVVNCLFREKVAYYSDPAQILTEINVSLKTYLGAESRFNSSAFLGFCNATDRTFIYANAGHDFPFFFQIKDRTVISLESTGTLLGIFRESTYFSRELKYEPGDRIFFYTDGLADYFERHAGLEDGYDAVRDFLLQHLHLSSRECMQTLEAALAAAPGEPSDDVTAIMMVVDS